MNRKTAKLSFSLMLAGAMALAAPQAMAAGATAPQSQSNTTGINGQVLDEFDEPIAGASVLVEGTTTGAVTDFDGNFEIPQATPGAKLQISFVGYTTQHIVATAGRMTIKLDPDTEILEETVVIGYGVQKKSNVTGAISSVKAEDLKNNVNTNAAQSLQGKVSGVQVVNASGAPGAAPQIRVRGYSSNGSSDPLYIVDGLKVSDIAYLDPSTIESMEVLKDAASAAIYGAEAGNGVVLITTNSGKKGATKVTLDASWSFQNLAKKVDVMNASQYKSFMTDAWGDAFNDLYNTFYLGTSQGADTNWQDEMYETGTMQKYNVGLQGGNDQGKFFFNAGYMNNNGMLVRNTDYYKRVTGQLNASYKLRPWLEVSSNNTVAYTRNHGVTEGNAQYGFMKGIINSDPLTPVYYSSLGAAPQIYQDAVANGMGITTDGDKYVHLSALTDNPLRSILANPNDRKVNGVTSFFINGMTSLNLTPFKGFVFTSRVGYTLGNFTEKNYSPAQWRNLTGSADANSQEPDLSVGQYTTHYYQWENFANYIIETDMGNWGLMAGMSFSDKSRDFTSGKTNELSSYASNFQYLDYSTASADDKVSGNLMQERKIAYFGRLSWDFLGRYQAQFNFRADSYDAAYLDLEHNWGFFPSASIGWTFSQEDFMKGARDKGILSFGKFRASYGVNGSVSNLGGYMYASTLNTGAAGKFLGVILAPMTYVIDGKMYQTTYPSKKLANPDLRWEESKQLDLGLDLRWFNDRLVTTFDYYHKTTDGLLVESTSLLTTGTRTIWQNVGKITNQGFEAEVEWRGKVGKDFNYNIKANIATVSNKVSEYKGEGVRIGGSGALGGGTSTYFEEGYPIWYIRGYEIDHIDAQTGMAVYKDHNGDGEITDNDRVNLGSAIPDFTYGITLGLGYKDFDLSIYGAGSQGNKLVYALNGFNAEYENRPTFLSENRWRKAGDQTSMPSAVQQLNDPNFILSNAMVRDASFFKIKQIQLGYTLPKDLLKKLTLQSLRIYASLDNFFTFTSYEGADPEASALSNSGGATASSMALDYGSYPSARTISFGINVAF